MPEPGSSNNPRWLPFRCHPFASDEIGRAHLAGGGEWDPGGAPFESLRANGLIPVMLSLP